MMTHLFPNCRKGPSILENLGKWQWAVNILQVLVPRFTVLYVKINNYTYSFLDFFCNIHHYLFSKKFKQIFVLFVFPKWQNFEIQAHCRDDQVFTSSINDASIFWNFENPTRCQNNLKSRRYILICNLNLGQALKQTCLVVYVWLILKS